MTSAGPLAENIAGARPNFMKIAPIIHAVQARQAQGSRMRLRLRLVQTGQHDDARMSGDFFSQLGSSQPDAIPVHARTAKTLAARPDKPAGLLRVDPQPDLDLNHLVRHAKGVITDSGGSTEETTVLGVPSITLRDSTQRPETVTQCTNQRIGTDPAALQPTLDRLFAGQYKKGSSPEKWDGKGGARIAAHLDLLLCE